MYIILFIPSIYFSICIAFQFERLFATDPDQGTVGDASIAHRVGSAAEYYIFENRKIMQVAGWKVGSAEDRVHDYYFIWPNYVISELKLM